MFQTLMTPLIDAMDQAILDLQPDIVPEFELPKKQAKPNLEEIKQANPDNLFAYGDALQNWQKAEYHRRLAKKRYRELICNKKPYAKREIIFMECLKEIIAEIKSKCASFPVATISFLISAHKWAIDANETRRKFFTDHYNIVNVISPILMKRSSIFKLLFNPLLLTLAQHIQCINNILIINPQTKAGLSYLEQVNLYIFFTLLTLMDSESKLENIKKADNYMKKAMTLLTQGGALNTSDIATQEQINLVNELVHAFKRQYHNMKSTSPVDLQNNILNLTISIIEQDHARQVEDVNAIQSESQKIKNYLSRQLNFIKNQAFIGGIIKFFKNFNQEEPKNVQSQIVLLAELAKTYQQYRADDPNWRMTVDMQPFLNHSVLLKKNGRKLFFDDISLSLLSQLKYRNGEPHISVPPKADREHLLDHACAQALLTLIASKCPPPHGGVDKVTGYVKESKAQLAEYAKHSLINKDSPKAIYLKNIFSHIEKNYMRHIKQRMDGALKNFCEEKRVTTQQIAYGSVGYGASFGFFSRRPVKKAINIHHALIKAQNLDEVADAFEKHIGWFTSQKLKKMAQAVKQYRAQLRHIPDMRKALQRLSDGLPIDPPQKSSFLNRLRMH